MDSVPQTPDQQTRNAVTGGSSPTSRRGWPRLGEPVVRHRGQYCYVAALLPGHREPAPILRLRYQGSADHWAIGIYKASTDQYTESELPDSFGAQDRHPRSKGSTTPSSSTPAPEPGTNAPHAKVRKTSEL